MEISPVMKPHNPTEMKLIGIAAIACYVPAIYLDIEELAINRAIEPAKLQKGLGLLQMALPDADEDAASFAANALWQLITENQLDPHSIGRIYLGTESALDAAKPTATYAVGAVEAALEKTYGPRCFRHCDVLDMTFACVGAVDALHNSIDWVSAGSGRKAVVIASDFAKYELGSTGEYTQGAGAVAMLIAENPSILHFSDAWGVSMQSVGDFHKPRRVYDKVQLLQETARLLGTSLNNTTAEALMQEDTTGFWSDPNAQVELFKEEPVFDGQYSNACYKDRIVEAIAHFRSQTSCHILSDWQHMVFHLPYAFQARRMVLEPWLEWLEEAGMTEQLYAEMGKPAEGAHADLVKAAAKSAMYKAFLAEKIADGESASSRIGNMYTASIFMSLICIQQTALDKDTAITGHRVGFVSYGSGSKSKVFEGTIAKDWKSRVSHLQLFRRLDERKAIDFATYEKLHSNKCASPVGKVEGFRLEDAGNLYPAMGIRKYTLR